MKVVSEHARFVLQISTSVALMILFPFHGEKHMQQAGYQYISYGSSWLTIPTLYV